MSAVPPVSTRSAARRVRRTGIVLAATAGVIAALATGAPANAAPRKAAAAVTAPQPVSADGLPTVQINGVAWAQVVVGNTVYVAGSFTSARPAGSPLGTNETPRENLLAYDITTGDLIQSFHHVLNAQATSIAASPDGTRVYVGGKFSTVDGVNQSRLAAFDVATGNLISSFKPTPNASVAALAVTNTTVYLGGAFSSVGGVARNRLAAVTAGTGALLPWAPVIDSYGINALLLTPDGTGVVLGGRFASLNGQPALGSGAVDAVTGASRPWALNQTIKGSNTAGTLTLTTDGTLIYGGNYTYGGGNFEGTWAADPSTGAIVWANDCLGDTYSLIPVNGVLYSSSHAHNCSAMGGFPETNPRSWQFALAYDTATGARYNTPDAYGNNFSAFHTSALLQWFPTLTGGTYTGASQAGWSVTGNSDYIAFGGEFPTVNGVKQQGLVRFPAHPISPNTFGPTGLGTPTASATATPSAAAVTVTATGAYDRDDATLRYDLYRPGVATPVASTTSPSTGFWTTQATVALTDPTAPFSTTLTYTLTASDPWGRTTSQPVTVTTPAAGPQWQPQPGAVSSAGSGSATIGTTTLTGTTLSVPFTATGSWFLPGPNGSCLKSGATTLTPTSVRVTTSQWGRYVGTATYTLTSSGTYGFQYACRGEFSTPTIGVATV